MRSFQPSAAVVIDESLNLVALLRELERLREQVRIAELARFAAGRPQKKNAHSAA